jgi:hypothetical protein
MQCRPLGTKQWQPVQPPAEHTAPIHLAAATLLQGHAPCLQARMYGGAIYGDANDGLLLVNTTVSHNAAGLAGGGVFFTSQNYPRLHANYSTIADNSVVAAVDRSAQAGAASRSLAGAGGGIAALGSIQMALNNTRVTGNVARSHGGGAFCMDCMNVEVVSSTVTGNRAVASGGGITLERLLGKSLVASTILADNTCHPELLDELPGGGRAAGEEEVQLVAAAVMNASIAAGRLAGCTSSSGGGGLCAQIMAGTLELADLVVSNNSAALGGEPPCLPLRLSACICGCLPACLLACLLGCLRGCLPTCLPACPSSPPHARAAATRGAVSDTLLRPLG